MPKKPPRKQPATPRPHAPKRRVIRCTHEDIRRSFESEAERRQRGAKRPRKVSR